MAKYMVIYVDVKDGDVEDVYESDSVGGIGKKAEKVTEPEESLPVKVKNDKAIVTFYEQSSPGCRYVHRRDCRYVKVCR